MLLSGCDNVSWGGVDFTIVPPPPPSPGAEQASDPEPGAERLPEGPVLYYVTVAVREGVLHPVAEILGDSLRRIDPGPNPSGYAGAFIAEHMRQGSEFVLYRGGSRAGTLVVQSAALEQGATCRPLPAGVGALELGANGEGATEFLALSRAGAPPAPRRAEAPAAPTPTMRTMAPFLAEPMLRARGATLPNDWQRAMAQLRTFPIEGETALAFTATFVMSDTLGPGLDDQGYSLFYIGLPRPRGFDTTFVRFHDYAGGGKRAPRVIDHLDWDRDGQAELLLRVFSTDDSWLEAADRDAEGRWRTAFENRCEVRPAPPARPDTSGG